MFYSVRLLPLPLFIISLSVSACDVDDSPQNSGSVCGEQFKQQECVDIGEGKFTASIEFESLGHKKYCVELQQSAAKPSRITSARVYLDSEVELIGPNDLNQNIASVAAFFEIGAGVHTVTVSKTATKKGQGELCLYADSSCRGLDDLPTLAELEDAASVAVVQLEQEGVLENAADPFTLVDARIDEILNLCPLGSDESLGQENESGLGEDFRHLAPDSEHGECVEIDPSLPYSDANQYCGPGACGPGTWGPLPRTSHYVNSCLNQDCRTHDLCYEKIYGYEECYWTKRTHGCDQALRDDGYQCYNNDFDEENAGQWETVEHYATKRALAIVNGLNVLSSSRSCCKPAVAGNPQFICSGTPLSDNPGVFYCVKAESDENNDIKLTLVRSDGTAFGDWDIAIDLRFDGAGWDFGKCGVHAGKSQIVRTVPSPEFSTVDVFVRVGPTQHACATLLSVSSPPISCD